MAMDGTGCDVSQCILLFLEQCLEPLICQTLFSYSTIQPSYPFYTHKYSLFFLFQFELLATIQLA
jgi:hypothetical protein